LIGTLLGAGDVRILSEERGSIGEKGARYLAVLDPVDGSSNFSRGIPFYCTSVCIIEGNRLRDASCALVRDLVRGDVYYAERGKGATRDGRRIEASDLRDLSRAVLGVDTSRGSAGLLGELGDLIASVSRQVHFGANALELCLVADGRVDAFVDIRGKMRVTDFAAACLIAKEAGAVITSRDGEELDPPLSLSSRFGYIAAGKNLHGAILKRLSGHSR
jgi:myo-inositol-1(or 4)-monophosphatase